MGSCAAPSAKGDDKFITTDYLQQCPLNGIIEADETFFAISYKGNHSKSKTFTMPRKAHKRGHSTHIRGLSKEKVCVPCAVNRNGLSISKITNTGRVSTKDLHHIYDGRIRGLTLSGTKTHVKQRFLPLTPLLMVSDVLWSPVLPA